MTKYSLIPTEEIEQARQAAAPLLAQRQAELALRNTTPAVADCPCLFEDRLDKTIFKVGTKHPDRHSATALDDWCDAEMCHFMLAWQNRDRTRKPGTAGTDYLLADEESGQLAHLIWQSTDMVEAFIAAHPHRFGWWGPVTVNAYERDRVLPHERIIGAIKGFVRYLSGGRLGEDFPDPVLQHFARQFRRNFSLPAPPFYGPSFKGRLGMVWLVGAQYQITKIVRSTIPGNYIILPYKERKKYGDLPYPGRPDLPLLPE